MLDRVHARLRERDLLPRIQKVVYSKDWKDGKSVSREGSSHMFKYVRLES